MPATNKELVTDTFAALIIFGAIIMAKTRNAPMKAVMSGYNFYINHVTTMRSTI